MKVILQSHPTLMRQKLPRLRKRVVGSQYAPANEVLIFDAKSEGERSSQISVVVPELVYDVKPDVKNDVTPDVKNDVMPDVKNEEKLVITNEKTEEIIDEPEFAQVPRQVKDQSTKFPKYFKKDGKKNNKSHGWIRRFFGIVLSLIIVVSLSISAVVLVPAVFYSLFPADVVKIESTDVGTPLGGLFELGVTNQEIQRYEPPVDLTLPEGDWIVIPRIGVRTKLQPTENPEEALETGVWWVPDFGGPGDSDLPMIVAAHRFGWQWWWKTDYWRYHSFNLLPDTEPGDIVEVISDQRKWLYEIYDGEEGSEITDYSADLILYTCKFLQGPLRHFRYARLIDPNIDTQESLSPVLDMYQE